jgi:hypothetical protein
MAAIPGHTLFVGDFAALEARFLDEVRSLKAADPLRPVDVLVGSNLLGVYLRRRAAEALGGIANLRFLTFLDLARDRTPAADPRPPLPPLGEELLARRTFRENPAGAAFGELRERPSLAALLLRTANDLREAGLSPDRLGDLLPAVAATPDRALRLGQVATLIADFESRRTRFSDPTSALERGAAASRPPSAEPLLVYGLYDLGGLRERLLAAVARERPVVAFVPDDGEDDDPASRERTKDLPPVRAALFTGLLGVDAERLPGPAVPAAACVVAPSEWAEARETVREILRAVDDGIPLHACGVLLRDPTRQEPALLAELRRRALPFFRPTGGGFSRTPAGRAALALLGLAARDFERGTLVELAEALEATTSPEGTPSLPPGSAARIERLLREVRFREGLGDFRRRAAEARARTGIHEAPDSESLGRLSTRSRRLHESVTTAEALLALVSPAIPETSPAPLPEWSSRLSAAVATLLPAGAERAALDAAFESLATLDRLEPGASVSASDLLALLPSALESVPVKSGRFERDGVAVLSAVSARGLLFDAVFVPGLTEQLFPRPGRPDPLLFDEERRNLSSLAGVRLAPRTGARHAREERFLFHVARTSARRRLVLLSARREAATDRPRLLSPFLLDVLAEAAGGPVREKDLASPGAVPGLRFLPLGVVDNGLAVDGAEALTRALARDPDLASRLASPPSGLSRAVDRARARAHDAFTGYDGLLGRSPARCALTLRPLSASRLERRASCAYRSFLSEGLGLEAPDDPPDALFLDALTLGTLAHAVLERLAGLAGTRGLGAVASPALCSVARAEVSKLFHELEADPPEPLLEAAESLIVARVEAVLSRERDRKERLPLSGAEVRFGPKEPLHPRVFLATGEVSLVGQIDRLDRDGAEALVVDYKFGVPRPFGKRNAKDYRIAGGERLQLAVYALAARELGASRPRGEYLFVDRDGDVSVPVPVAFDEEETKDAVDRFVAALALLDEAAARGHFFPKTTPFASRSSHCGNCDFNAVCGPGHARVYDRKREAERAREPESPLFALEEIR